MNTLLDVINKVNNTGKFVLVYANDVHALVEFVEPVENDLHGVVLDTDLDWDFIQYKTIDGIEGYMKLRSIWGINITNKTKRELDKDMAEEEARGREIYEAVHVIPNALTKKETLH